MKTFSCVLLLASSAVGLKTRQAEHPIESTINLLESLKAKVDMEAKLEEVTYAKYEYWCKNSVTTMTSAISQGKATIESLESKVSSLQEEKTVLTDQVDKLGQEILKAESAADKALGLRTKTNNLFQAADGDYDATIQAIKDALAALQDAHTATEPALIQGSSAKAKLVNALTLGGTASSLTASQKAQITELLNAFEDPDARDVKAAGDYDKHTDVYDFKSHSVIELLKNLQRKFEDEKQASLTAETNSLNAYTLEKQSRDTAIAQAKASQETKQIELGEVDGALTTAVSDLDNERSDLTEEENTLSSTQKACLLKKDEYIQRQQVRSDEQEALSQAAKILAQVSGIRMEPPSNPVPPPSPVAFLATDKQDPKARAIKLLRESAKQTHSRALERLAEEINLHLSGPFDEVNNMIQKMIFRLNQEQKDEDEHKHWCDLEVNKTDSSIVDKSAKMEELKTKIDEATARSGVLAEEIVADNERVAIITKHMADSEEIRSAGKEENRLALKDAQDAQKALANAIAVLDAYYKNSGMVAKEPWEFIQEPEVLTEPPSTWDKSYTGLTDPTAQPKGIISILKSVAAKFSEMEASTNANEANDQHFFEEDMKNSKIEKARHEKEAEMKTEEKHRLADKLTSLQASHKHVADEKGATQQYMEDLRHACVDGDSTYEERVAAREKEVTALKEAQVILRDAFKKSFLQKRS